MLAGHFDWETAKRELRTLGYKPSGHGDDSRWKRGPFIVELHHNVLGDERVAARISGLGASNAEIDGEVWARARPLVLGEPFLMPAPEDHLLIMCAHLMKHGFEPCIWFVDLEALLLETESFDWAAALDRADRWGLLRAVAFAFRNLGALGGIENLGERGDLLPPGVRAQLAEIRLTSLDSYLLTLAAKGERISGEKKEWRRVPIGNLLWLSSQPTFAGKIRLLWEASFPRGEVMEEIYPDYRPAMRWWFMARRAADLVRLGGRVLALTGWERSR